MVKQTVEYSYNGKLLSNKKKIQPNNMNLHNIRLSERSKIQKEFLLTYVPTVWLHFDDILEEVKLIHGDRNQNSGCFCV